MEQTDGADKTGYGKSVIRLECLFLSLARTEV
jgi:hypothetical protein